MSAVIPGAQYMLNEFDWQSAMQVFAALLFMISFALFMRALKSQPINKVEDNQTLKEALSGSVCEQKLLNNSRRPVACGMRSQWTSTSYLADKNLPASQRSNGIGLWVSSTSSDLTGV